MYGYECQNQCFILGDISKLRHTNGGINKKIENGKIHKITKSIENLDVKGQAHYCAYDCALWYGNSPYSPTGCNIKISAYNSTSE